MSPSFNTIDSLVHIDPSDQITFDVILKSQTITKMYVQNITDQLLAYKMKTTNTNRYSVRPNAAVIKPYSTISIVITQKGFNEPSPEFKICSDLFQLLVVKLSDVPTNTSQSVHDPSSSLDDLTHPLGYPSVMKLWESVPSSHTAKKKFFVRIRMADVGDEVQVVDEEQKVSISDEQRSLLTQTVPTSQSNTPTTSQSPYISRETPKSQIDAMNPSIQTRTSVTSSKRTQLPPTAPPFPEISTQADTRSTKTLSSSSMSKPVMKPRNQITPSTQISSMKTSESVTPTKKKSDSPKQPTTPTIDYKSIQFARQRAVEMNVAPKISPPEIDALTRQRVAVERAGELVRVINSRQKEIEAVKKDLLEAKHKLSDARIATQPAYDVRYEINESARVPIIQICIMAIISGALLQLLI